MTAIPTHQDSLPDDHAAVAREYGYDLEAVLDSYDEHRTEFTLRCAEQGWRNPRRDGYYVLVDIEGVPTLMTGPDGYAWERGKSDPMNLWTMAGGRVQYLTFLRERFDEQPDNVRRIPWARKWLWLARLLRDDYTLVLGDLQRQARNLEPFPPKPVR